MNNTIVSFHVGRGGRFNNPGHLYFLGQMDIQQLLTLCDNSRNHTFYYDRDKAGRFIPPAYFDSNGNKIITMKQVETGVGYLEWDTTYNTDYAIRLEDCDEKELQAILDYNGFVPSEILDYCREQLNTVEL